jgi:L-alanine-DL-glutamate epimerase-like enolase superfamily enzyme
MKITEIETFVVNTGFKPPRPWHFCAIRTDEGLTGYSEFGSEGLTRGLVGLVQDLGARLIGKDPSAVEKHYLDMYRAVRQAPYGATQQAIAGIELALWDLAGKSLGVPVWRLMGGPHRERQRVYWSHCATYRVENWEHFRVKPLRTMADVADCAREAVAKGYTALKTNIIWPGNPARRITQGRTGPHDQLATRDIIDQAVAQIGAMREAVGPKIDICLDVDTIMVDVCWQGFSAAKKVADLAETHEINVAPHNYNGHLSSFQALNFVASVSNVKIMESDPDAVPLRDELFTVLPEIKDGQMTIPIRPGWGTELNEKAARAHPWEG